MLAKCPACKGGKEVMGIGMLTQKCKHCKGTGQVKVINVDTYIKAGEKFISETVKVEQEEKHLAVTNKDVKIDDKPKEKGSSDGTSKKIK